MTCVQVRTAISALLDGEPPVLRSELLDGHLAGCAACREWRARAEHVTRAVRVQSVEVPDLTATVLAAVAAESQDRRGERRQVLRWAVALAAIAQLVLAVPVLLGGSGVMNDAHLTREMASLDIAVAVGFLLAAIRPDRARALAPVAFVLAGCLAITSAMDVANASTAIVHEVGHLVAAAQAALVWALGKTSPRLRLPGIAATRA